MTPLTPAPLRALALATLCGAGAASAGTTPVWSAVGAFQEGVPRVEATLLSELRQVAPGDRFRVGVRFQMPPGWHIYWRNPGEAGMASEVSWKGSGLDVGPLRWPAPSVLRSPDGSITTYGYPSEVVLFADAHAGAPRGGTVRLSALADVLVCEVECIPASLSLERELGVGARPVVDAEARALLDAATARLPRPAGEAGVKLALVRPLELVAGSSFSAEVLASGPDGRPVQLPTRDAFIPDRLEGIPSIELQPRPGATGMLQLRGKVVPEAQGGPRLLRGVLRLAGARPVEAQLALGSIAPAAAAVAAAPTSGTGLGWALLFAFLGGVLLNLMPCVFPVLALKAYGFVRTVHAGGGRAGGHALAYTAGIVGSLLLLAVVVLGLRAAGHAVGWGFQFQEPLFVAALASLMVGFALNLFGVFRVGVGAGGTALAGAVDGAEGPWRAAGEGVLAVVLATPCTAPLLGTAVGFAFSASPWVVVAVFLLIGLGLALPFCVLVLVPALGARLPPPGAWMERARQLLGFALLATAAWLASVVGGLAGVEGLSRLLAFLVVVGVAAWAVGAWQDGPRPWLAVGAAAVLLLVSGAALLRFDTARPAALATPGWDPAVVTAELRAGHPVFVDFTADWCLTCKFNERFVLSRPAVQQAFASTGTRVLVADWTRPDARIASELATHGRAGVPMYLLWSPHRPDAPELLPELLTESRLVESLHRAASQLSAEIPPAPALPETVRP